MKDRSRDDDIITDEERQVQDAGAVAEYDGEKSNRARLVEAEGDDYRDEPVRDNTIEGRISNFWYHYKWRVVIVFACVLFLFVGIYQLAGKETPDVSVLYTGPVVISGDDYTALGNSLSEVLSEDINGDGKKNTYLYAINYFSEKQIEEQKEAYAAQGINDTTFNTQVNTEAYSSFTDMVFAGEAGVMFLDYDLFVQVRDAGGLVTLESVLGTTPDSAVDEYGIRLGDTAFYKFYTSAKIMPEDTVLCLRGPSTAGGVFTSKKSVQKAFEHNSRLFCDIVNFELPAGFAE